MVMSLPAPLAHSLGVLWSALSNVFRVTFQPEASRHRPESSALQCCRGNSEAHRGNGETEETPGETLKSCQNCI